MGQELLRKVRNVDASQLREAVKEVNETGEKTERPSLGESSPGIVFLDESVPFLIEESHCPELLLGREEPSYD